MSERPAQSRGIRWILAIAVLEIANASYLSAFDTPSIFYHVNVVLHVVLGLPLAAAIVFRSIPALLKGARRSGGAQAILLRALAMVAAVFVISGLVMAYTGTARPWYPLLQLHVVSAVAGGLLLLALVWAWASAQAAKQIGTSGAGAAAGAGGGSGRQARLALRWNMAVLGLALAFPLAVHAWRAAYPPHVVKIVNPASPPLSADVEGGGEKNPFFPSSNETVGAKYLPSDFFLDSKASCGTAGCHPDIVKQWEGSMHHFSSFNNQWYRKSIEYMQDTVGTKSSKWCGGCHDMAVLLTGRMDRPIKEQIDTPESQAGIGCLVCHSIVHVKDTMGQGGFVLEYPEMHRLASSKSPIMKGLHDYMTFLDPAPHRATMLKPFHRESTPQFCSACHKVHLDAPVNHYRWFRGFNEYDPWQQSGVSGQGARAFYYPPESKTCKTCHMPMVKSADAGNVAGLIHDHRFPGANTAVPFANGDQEQLQATTKFLKENSVSVDIFGLVELDADSRPGSNEGGGGPAARGAQGQEEAPATSSLFAGEEGVVGSSGGSGVGIGSASESRLLAPIPSRAGGETGLSLERGRDYLIEVVTRTRNVGHMFPGGTVDAFDVWVELKGEDEKGAVVFWSGWVRDDEGGRKGPVDPSAHFYRSLLLDGHGNPINKRNAWSARALMYARLIPPGAADTTHFRVRLPEDCGERVTFTARVNYRKFAWWNTQWSYAGVRDPNQAPYETTPHYDDGKWVFTGDTSKVSGSLKSIPDLPIIEVAADVKSFAVSRPGAGTVDLPPPARDDPKARERFNDYGIGLLLQRDLKGAAAAFRRVTEIDPNYADGFVNVARAQIDEGDHTAARATLEEALRLSPELPKAHYFYALTLKTVGAYDEAISHLNRTLASFPDDRVVLNQVGRLLFLQRRHDEAIRAFQRVLAVDPEDLQAHYNLMLCYRGKGDVEQARREEALYARFKADESAQEITGDRRRSNPDDNKERQLIHEHRSTWAGVPGGHRTRTGYAGQ